MNTLKSTLGAIALVGTLVSSGCTLNQMMKLAKDQDLKVNPSPLELHGDSVIFNMSAKLPAKMLKKGTTYSVKTSFKPTDGEALPVGEVVFKGDDVKNPEAQPKLDKRFSFAYEDRLERGEVKIKGIAAKGTKTKETPEMSITDGVITTSRMAQPTFYANYIPHKYENKEEYEPQNMEFFFEKGKSDLRKSEKKGKEAGRLDTYISAKLPTRTVSISGMHSPEGSTSINTRLANERPKAIEDYYKELIKKYNAEKEAASVGFVHKPVIENWTAFKALLKDYTKINDTQKNQVLAIVDGPGDFVSKELKLQTLPFYRTLFRDLYPPLRTAKAEILKIKEKMTDAEVVVLAKKIANGQEDASKLNAEQIAYAATQTPDLAEKEKIYQAAIKQYDANYSYNNLGAVYLDMAKKAATAEERNALIDKAITQFELSIKRNATAEAHANLAGALLMKGDVKGSDENLSKASGSANAEVGTTVNALKGYTSIRKGEYDAAIQALSSGGNDAMVLYNKALAYLLKASQLASTGATADYSKAESSFAEAMSADANNAHVFYGAAITATRMKKADKAIEYLGKAVKLNSKLKERAVKDLEFKNFWKDAKFLEILK
jgi:tetratricopeptide (TPR) repeat protein